MDSNGTCWIAQCGACDVTKFYQSCSSERQAQAAANGHNNGCHGGTECAYVQSLSTSQYA